MYTWPKCARLSKTECSPRAKPGAQLGKRSLSFWGSLLFTPLLLAGCSNSAVSSSVDQPQQAVIPDSKVVDYRIASCDSLWQLTEKDALENSLYWLRAVDCADRLGSTQARALAKTLPGSTWDGALKQNILLGSAEPTSAERRQMIERLNRYSLEFPNSLRPLLQLWRQQQTLQIALFDERARYQRLQESTDNQIDSLRQNQVRLQGQLQDTSRKLENLTDIERQLSSRKQMQGELPDNRDADAKPAAPAKTAEPAPSEKGTALPVEPEDNDTPPADHKESKAQ